MTSLFRMQRYLASATVTGFETPLKAGLLYAGSLFWFLLLVTHDLRLIIRDDDRPLHTTILCTNILMFTLQTWNVVVTLFRAWPVISLYYASQLFALALRSSLVETEWLPILALFAQCLFTSSQLGVTFEFLHRVSFHVLDVPHIPVRRFT